MTKYLAALSGVFVAALITTATAETWWPHFRGPNCSGVSETAKPPAEFAPGTNQLWKIATPSGMSSPCVWRDRIFLTAFDGGKLQTLCYQRRDGKLLWKQDARVTELEEFHATEGSPAASTPATDGDRVVSYFGSCGLVCYDLNGKELWQHPLPVAQTAGSFGTGCSPLIAGGLVLLNRDQRQGCSAARGGLAQRQEGLGSGPGGCLAEFRYAGALEKRRGGGGRNVRLVQTQGL